MQSRLMSPKRECRLRLRVVELQQTAQFFILCVKFPYLNGMPLLLYLIRENLSEKRGENLSEIKSCEVVGNLRAGAI